MASDFYKQSLEEHVKQIQKDCYHPNLRQEEKLLLKEYQDYLEGVRVQQDKIMRTASYPPSQLEVPAARIEERTNETRDIEIVARNRNTDEQHENEETTYTIRMSPYLTSFRELCLEHVGGQHDSPEQTRIAGTTWAKLKPSAMAENYQQKNWYFPLTAEEKQLLEALRTAQFNQGDMNELKVQPYIDADACKNIENLRDVIFKIRETPELGSSIIRAFVDRMSKSHVNKHLSEEAKETAKEAEAEDSKFLMNFSNLFYGNLYLEDKTALSKNSHFIETFNHFMQKENFKTDQSGNVVLRDHFSLQVIKILFEG